VFFNLLLSPCTFSPNILLTFSPFERPRDRVNSHTKQADNSIILKFSILNFLVAVENTKVSELHGKKHLSNLVCLNFIHGCNLLSATTSLLLIMSHI
jgi:hypothetical protein